MKRKFNEEKFIGPKVVFRDLALQVSVGQWLEIISSQTSFRSSGMTISMPLSAKELMARIMIPKKKLNEVSKVFGYLLGTIGIPLDETCVLSNIDSEEFIFKCYLNKAKCEYTIRLRWGCFLDSFPELTIDFPNEQKVYEFFAPYEDKTFRLELQDYTIKNEQNGNSYNRIYSPYSVYYTLENKNYSMSLSISIPEELRVSGKDCVLRNEEALQDYFLGLEFPIDINEVYKKIRDLSLDSVDVYPEFELKVEKKVDAKLETITDLLSLKTGRMPNCTITADGRTVSLGDKAITDIISLKNGQLQNYIITKDGKIISLDGKGNWSYDTNQISVNHAENGEISYSVTGVHRDGLETTSDPALKCDIIIEEVEAVKNYVKSL